MVKVSTYPVTEGALTNSADTLICAVDPSWQVQDEETVKINMPLSSGANEMDSLFRLPAQSLAFGSLPPDIFNILNVIRYVCRNPIRANISKDLFEYRYLRLPKVEDIDIHPIISSENNFTQEDLLQWISGNVSTEEEDSIRRSLSRRQFKSTKSPKTQKMVVFDSPFIEK